MAKTNITIIGGGACGVAVFIELFLQLKLKAALQLTKITIVEKDGKIGKGMAFGTERPEHLLNTSAELMGIFSYESKHYSEWLKENEKELENTGYFVIKDGKENTFTSRGLYSKYLYHQYLFYYNLAQQEGLEIEIIFQKAINLEKEANHWKIILDGPAHINSEIVILALGTPKPDNYIELEGISIFFNFPWPTSPILQKIPKHAPVGILGSSLSAVDMVVSLQESGHTGTVTLYSPDGLLPRVQPVEEKKLERNFLTVANIHKIQRQRLRKPKISELFYLFKKEVNSHMKKPLDWKGLNRIGRPAGELLVEDIDSAKSGGDEIINIILSLRYEASLIWSWLNIEEKLKFIEKLGVHWDINRHGMPLTNAEKLIKFFRKGQLDVKPYLKNVSYDKIKKRFVVDYKDNRDEVAYLINATGPGKDVKEMKSVLIQNLYQSGVIEPHDAGGIKINPENMEVIAKGKGQQHLYAVGHLCNGELLDVNAVWYNVETIHRMCRAMINEQLSICQ